MTQNTDLEMLKQWLAKAFPDNFDVIVDNGRIILQDTSLDKGEGYSVTIEEDIRFIRAKLEFDDYAKPLLDFANFVLDSRGEEVKEMTRRHPYLTIVRHRLVTETLNDGSSISSVWWLQFELRKSEIEEASNVIFANLIVYWIFLLLPYRIEGAFEGKVTEEVSLKYERNRSNRSICLAVHGYDCKACGMNMKKRYLDLHSEFVHVHHINPVSESGIVRFDPINDLIPLCPNCHQVAHLKNPPYTVSEIREMIKDI